MIKSRIMRWTRQLINTERTTYVVLMRRPEGKGLLGRPRNEWGNSIKLNVKDVVWEGVVWNFWLRKREMPCSFEHGYELSGSVKLLGISLVVESLSTCQEGSDSWI
jgi:hypothetical protein